jgi:hypothetical protein
MHPIHDRPEDRAIRRVLTWVIVGGTVAGTLFAYPRYGLFSLSTVGLAGLGMMLATGGYAAVLAILPSTSADEPPPPEPPAV